MDDLSYGSAYMSVHPDDAAAGREFFSTTPDATYALAFRAALARVGPAMTPVAAQRRMAFKAGYLAAKREG